MSKDNLTVIPGGGTPSITKDAIRRLREDLPIQIEFYGMLSKLIRAKFEALVAEGFTEAQALELSRTV